jgi:hypothetical protein
MINDHLIMHCVSLLNEVKYDSLAFLYTCPQIVFLWSIIGSIAQSLKTCLVGDFQVDFLGLLRNMGNTTHTSILDIAEHVMIS